MDMTRGPQINESLERIYRHQHANFLHLKSVSPWVLLKDLNSVSVQDNLIRIRNLYLELLKSIRLKDVAIIQAGSRSGER